MWILYDFIFLIITLVHLPVYLLRRKIHPGFQMRLGILPSGLKLNKPIWIHAVSVGEAMAVKNLVRELRITYPDKRFFISTVTPTGNKIAKGIAKETDFVAYFPLDLSFVVRRVVDKINPSLFIIMETEIWPNLISCLYRKKIPIVLVNGRLSDRSFKGYRCIKFLLKPLLNKINLFCVQTKTDAQRLMRLGGLENKIKITGNMKFDLKDCADLKKDYIDCKLKLGLKSDEKLFVASSTHPGEEGIILGVYKELLREFPDLRLLIAPRHPERATEIVNLIKKFDFESKRISVLLDKRTNEQTNKRTIFILDTIGQLLSFYAIADIVFVGGSLIKKGGHNILEPASLGKPVIFGPYMFNFRDIAGLFLENKACVLAHNREELFLNIKDLLRNPGKSTELSQRAKAIILQNQGATTRNLECISNYISTQK